MMYLSGYRPAKNSGEQLTHDALQQLLPDVVTVEYNGRQHYHPVPIHAWETEEEMMQRFADQKIRDRWLCEYCRRMNYGLIIVNGKTVKPTKLKPYLKGRLDECINRGRIRRPEGDRQQRDVAVEVV